MNDMLLVVGNFRFLMARQKIEGTQARQKIMARRARMARQNIEGTQGTQFNRLLTIWEARVLTLWGLQ